MHSLLLMLKRILVAVGLTGLKEAGGAFINWYKKRKTVKVNVKKKFSDKGFEIILLCAACHSTDCVKIKHDNYDEMACKKCGHFRLIYHENSIVYGYYEINKDGSFGAVKIRGTK